uniref:Uncharacterized protein n=1 Tax=Onchocerca volvulus TaxID=6282 RepID=A0A8R1TPS9_ONCVO
MSKVNFFKKYAHSELSERYHKIGVFQNGIVYPRRKFYSISKPFNLSKKLLNPVNILFDDGIVSTDLMHNYSAKIRLWSSDDGKHLGKLICLFYENIVKFFVQQRPLSTNMIKVISKKNSMNGFVIPAALFGSRHVFIDELIW